jgi:ATP-dependent exoDNAse (exonuclease V) alpha subunit
MKLYSIPEAPHCILMVVNQNPKRLDLSTLEAEQHTIWHRLCMTYSDILCGLEPEQTLIQVDGSAGCGKTYLIDAICQELRDLAKDEDEPNPVRVLAPSGAAALNVRGQTIHSALGLPVNTDFVPLTGARLARLQTQWKGIKILIIDEKSMLGLKTLAMIDSRLRQLIPHGGHLPFGGLHVVLCGDFAQLPPVGDRPLYGSPSSGSPLSSDGNILYKLFKKSYCLKVLHRQEGDSPDQLAFKSLLKHASHGGLSFEDWEFLNKRAEANLTPAEQASFHDAICLYTTRDDVEAINLAELAALNRPCARIQARHEGGQGGHKASADEAGGLENHVFLSKGARVMVTRNLWSDKGMYSFLSLDSEIADTAF